MFILDLSLLPRLGFRKMEAEGPSTSGLSGGSDIAETPSGVAGVPLALSETVESLQKPALLQ